MPGLPVQFFYPVTEYLLRQKPGDLSLRSLWIYSPPVQRGSAAGGEPERFFTRR